MPLLRDVKDELGSSYLRDHADNPVEWRTWDEDTLALARAKDRPIFLSVGYAACHWCHVMAHESFENEDVAKALNASFIAIKVDREERPDVDALYMAATQMVSGHGGWPMSVFLTPDGRPFMAGTYYPLVDRAGQWGFNRLVNVLADAWRTQRSQVEAQADEIARALEREVRFVEHLVPYEGRLDLAEVRRRLRDELVSMVDEHGGFGGAPKFPRPSFVEALLEFDDGATKAAIARTLDAMAREGLFDHLEGGFARYSVDGEWHVPHFEKMLSDQALLARCYLRAARVLGRPDWLAVARATLDFAVRDLASHGGFASSLDADAGGREGSHVIWKLDEVAEVLDEAGLGDQLEAVARRWRIERPGAFEGASIPRLADDQPFETPPALRAAEAALRARRATRPQPARDDKVVLEWNAMLASALLASDDLDDRERALELLGSLATTHWLEERWWRTQRRGAPAGAADLAWYADALVDAFEVTGEDEWLERAESVARYLLDHHWDGPVPHVGDPHVGGGLFTQGDLVHDLPTRPKDIFDGATPSAHSVATRALARLGLCRGNPAWMVVAQRLVELAATLVDGHPTAVPDLIGAAGFALDGVEVVVPGDPGDLARHVRLLGMPRTVVIPGGGSSPLLAGRREGLAYVCRGGVCQLPSASAQDLDEQLRSALSPWHH